jgi:hypothetical protein
MSTIWWVCYWYNTAAGRHSGLGASSKLALLLLMCLIMDLVDLEDLETVFVFVFFPDLEELRDLVAVFIFVFSFVIFPGGLGGCLCV